MDRYDIAKEIHSRISIVKSSPAMEDSLIENVYLELEDNGKWLLKFEDLINWHIAEIEKAKKEVAENFFKHESVGEYDPRDYLRNILKQQTKEQE